VCARQLFTFLGAKIQSNSKFKIQNSKLFPICRIFVVGMVEMVFRPPNKNKQFYNTHIIMKYAIILTEKGDYQP
jgi:hypothetical protein